MYSYHTDTYIHIHIHTHIHTYIQINVHISMNIHDIRSQCVQGPCSGLVTGNLPGERLRMHHSRDPPTLGVAGGRLSFPQIGMGIQWICNWSYGMF